MYKEGFIGVVKVGGKIMREQNGEIHLPFGSEYSILLKNKESRKAVVTIEIDGMDVLNGKQLIVCPNQDTELQGFLRGDIVKNRFKFIQKTKEIQDYRGDKIDDGMIRIGFRYELPVISNPIIYDYPVYRSWYSCLYYHYNYPVYPLTYTTCGTVPNNISNGISSSYDSHLNTVSNAESAPSQDEGITVKGSEVNQSFNVGYTNQLESQEKVIMLILKGYTKEDGVVESPITVLDKRECPTCGRKYSTAAKFCDNCGTCLTY